MSGFRFDGSSLERGLSAFEDRFEAAVHMYAETGATKLQNFAQTNAPWTDRTGHARQRLNAKVSREGNGGYLITLAHGVDYGIWLELANEKKFAVIEKTILECGKTEVLPGFERLLNRLGGG